jgi:hypothetical protein
MINSSSDRRYGWVGATGATNVSLLALRAVALADSFQSDGRFSLITRKVLPASQTTSSNQDFIFIVCLQPLAVAATPADELKPTR